MINEIRIRLRALFRRKAVEAEMEEELRAHLEHQTEKYVRSGIPREEAARRARLELGGLEQVKEECRDARGVNFIETTMQDVRYGLRQLRRNPVFTIVAVVTVALGIGATSAIFSVVNAVLLRPLPYRDAGKLVVILHHGQGPVAPANFLDWRSQNHVFADMGAAEYWTPNLSGVDRPEQIWALRVTSDIFPLLGVEPIFGRTFLPEEGRPGQDREAVLSYSLWQRRFGGESSVIGQSIMLDGEKYTVVGVMPRGFKFAPFWATKAELWAPLSLADRAGDRVGSSLRVFARLKPGVTIGQARAEMATITGRLEKLYPGTNRHYTVLPLMEKVVGNIRPALLVLLATVSFVLLIACANVAHMQLARAASRQKEVAVRTALGAGRSRVVRQILTESLLLALLGGSLGLLLGLWGMRVLGALSPPGIPRVETVSLDSHVLVFLVVASVLTALGFGLAPALHASEVSLNDSLRESERGSGEGIRHNRLRSLLVVSEFALALILLVGAGLMLRSFVALQAVDPGFNPEHLLTMLVSVTGSESAEPSHRTAFYQGLLDEVRGIPGVRSAGAINHLPLAGDLWNASLLIEGRPVPPPGESPQAVYRVVLPGYFRSMEIPILRGRDVANGDNLNAPAVVVVNEALARNLWPGQVPLGKRIALRDTLPNPQWLTVIGVARNAKQDDWAAKPNIEVYLPYLQSREYLEGADSHHSYLTLVVRAEGDPASLAPAIESSVWALDKNVTVSQVQTMPQVLREAEALPRLYLMLLGAFAAVALILAGVGIYGVMSYSVSSRTHEIGVRMALGAARGEVLGLVVAQGFKLTLMGVGVGIVGALALRRFIASLLYGVRPTDPLTFAVVCLLLIGAALLASYIPARRASKLDPMVALRYE
jgi:putative ABC transport system permease protein